MLFARIPATTIKNYSQNLQVFVKRPPGWSIDGRGCFPTRETWANYISNTSNQQRFAFF